MDRWYMRNGISYILPLAMVITGIIALVFVAVGRLNQGVLLIAAPMTMVGLFLLAFLYVIKSNNKENKEE